MVYNAHTRKMMENSGKKSVGYTRKIMVYYMIGYQSFPLN